MLLPASTCLQLKKVMRINFSFLLIVFFPGTCLYSQVNNYNNLLDTARGNSNLLILKKPLQVLDTGRISSLLRLFIQDEKPRKQILTNLSKMDTSLRTTSEFSNCILLNDREEKMNLRQVIDLLKLTDTAEINPYKNPLDEFNHTEPGSKTIYRFSRLVFDDLKTYALIQCDDAEPACGGVTITSLYIFESQAWHFIGNIL